MASIKVPWLHILRRSLFVPFTLVPGSKFNKMNNGTTTARAGGNSFTII